MGIIMTTLASGAEPIVKHEHLNNLHRRQNNEDVTVYVTKYVTATVYTGYSTAFTSFAAKDEANVPEPDIIPSSSSGSISKTNSGSLLERKKRNAGQNNGSARGIVYSPYKPGGCKTADEVKADVAQLSSFPLIRLYGVDCDQVSNVLAALAPNQKVFLGVFDMNSIENSIKTINNAVQTYSQGWDIVDTISIGNELVNNGQASVDKIASYLTTARQALTSYGYGGKVVSVDTFIAVINNPGLCKLSDYHAVNAHAFFDGNIEAAGSGDWLVQQVERVKNACGDDKPVFISETGWPSKGESNGKAVPSQENQRAAINSIEEKIGNNCILFTAFNDYWKADGPFGAEKYYGIFDS